MARVPAVAVTVAVPGTDHGAHWFHHHLPGVPQVYKCLTDFGCHDFPGDVEAWCRAVVFASAETAARWRLAAPGKARVIPHGIDV
ncbi:MAG: hypothetical protein QHJ73_15530, partial [Armatimonadota bacterium]|nr:hypothetical protein [Armatimonadota bacterium]